MCVFPLHCIKSPAGSVKLKIIVKSKVTDLSPDPRFKDISYLWPFIRI